MAELTRPPSLRAFLDAGCDLITIPGWECLAESVVLYRPSEPAKRVREAEQLRRYAETWLHGELTPIDKGARDNVEQDVVTRFLWEAECLEDPELAERFEAALPAETRAELLLVGVEALWPEDEQ